MNSPEGLYDSHFHLDEIERKGTSSDELLSRLISKGWKGGIDVVTDLGKFSTSLERSLRYPGLFLSAGLYPKEAETPWKARLPALADCLKTPKTVAVGEIGIDLYWDYATPEDQKDLFAAQIEVANASRLPIIVHCRNGEAEVLQVLKNRPPVSGGVLHCFSGSLDWAKQLLDFGLFISFAGNLTYPKNVELRNCAASLPLDRILVETDSPYLSPQGFRGSPNNPEHVQEILQTIAEIRNLNMSFLKEELWRNFLHCFPRLT